MANTLAAALVTDHLADGFIKVAGNLLAPLSAFSTDFGVKPLAPRATVQVPKFTATSAAQSNPTNFETGDTTATAVAVTVAQVSKSFHLTNAEINQGHTLARLAGINAQTFAHAISDIWTALLQAADFASPAPRVIGTTATFDASDLPDVYGDAKNFELKHLVLDGGHMARLLPANMESFKLGQRGAYGFDGMFQQNRWTGAVANTVGFCCAPAAIAVASGLPLNAPAGEMMDQRTVTIPGLELAVQINLWFARASRTYWASFDVMFGAAVGDSTQGLILKSA